MPCPMTFDVLVFEQGLIRAKHNDIVLYSDGSTTQELLLRATPVGLVAEFYQYFH
jgi:hypothetical protein